MITINIFIYILITIYDVCALDKTNSASRLYK